MRFTEMASITLSHVTKQYKNGFKAVDDFNLRIGDHEFIVLVGPSGCGKSTTLRMIAGLEQISSGELWIDRQLCNEVAPGKRGLAMVFQNYALYPHMTVRQNLSFALEAADMSKDEITKRVDHAADLLELSALMDRKPAQLSGGQRQRVAIGSAIVRDVKAYLMDEPLSNLDAKLRTQMRVDLKRLYDKLSSSVIYVTHDQVEAMTLATRIVVMNEGRVQQVGRPQEIYDHPANRFVAGFIGSPQMNFLDARAVPKADGVFLEGENFEAQLPRNAAKKLMVRDYVGRDVVVGIRPEDLIPVADPQSMLNCIAFHQELGENLGSYRLLHGRTQKEKKNGEYDKLIARAEDGIKVPETADYYLQMALDKVHLFDPTTGVSLLRDEDSTAKDVEIA